MNARLYLILSLLSLSVQYSRSQFLDYIPLEHKNNSYEDVTKEAREFEEYVRRRELELERKLEYDRRAEITRRAAQPVVINEELVTATGLNISQEKEVTAKINQKTYSDGQVVNYVIGLKYNNNWISIKETLLPKISVLIKKAESDGQDEIKQFLLEMSEYANYVLVVGDEFILF